MFKLPVSEYLKVYRSAFPVIVEQFKKQIETPRAFQLEIESYRELPLSLEAKVRALQLEADRQYVRLNNIAKLMKHKHELNIEIEGNIMKFVIIGNPQEWFDSKGIRTEELDLKEIQPKKSAFLFLFEMDEINCEGGSTTVSKNQLQQKLSQFQNLKRINLTC